MSREPGGRKRQSPCSGRASRGSRWNYEGAKIAERFCQDGIMPREPGGRKRRQRRACRNKLLERKKFTFTLGRWFVSAMIF